MATLDPAEERARRVLVALRRHRGYSDKRLGELAGMSRQSVEQRRRGETPIKLRDIDHFAEALRANPLVFLMEPDEALRWVLDHDTTPDTLNGAIPGLPLTPGQRVLEGAAA